MTIMGRNLAVLGGAAAAVLAGVYIMWGPGETKKKSKKATCPGLVNLGNTCFLNAILQAMAPCSSVVQWLADFASKHAARHHSSYLSEPVLDVLKVLNNDGIEMREEVSAVDVIDALKARRWVISTDEQDAHEMFHVLTETLDEETARYPSVASLFDADSIQDSSSVQVQPETTARNRHDTKLPLLPNREADHPFRGLLASQLQCTSCAYKCPVRYDTFDSLSLTIPSNKFGSALTLDRLLKHYIMSETVQNVECGGCGSRQSRGQTALVTDTDTDADTPLPKSTFVKKLTLGKLPQCLCIHIQRTVWLNNGIPVKKYEHVHFPEVLNMSDYSYQKWQSKCRPSTLPGLDLVDIGAGLVGGRRNVNGFHTKRLGSTSPTVTVPYSGPVNLLKALNYHTRTTTMGGLTMQMQAARADQNSAGVRQLAHTYSTEVMSPMLGAATYKLTAVVVHHGDVFSGHFVTYRRAPSTNGQRFLNRWLYTSDTLVKKATLADVLRTNAYMLFYEKI